VEFANKNEFPETCLWTQFARGSDCWWKDDGLSMNLVQFLACALDGWFQVLGKIRLAKEHKDFTHCDYDRILAAVKTLQMRAIFETDVDACTEETYREWMDKYLSQLYLGFSAVWPIVRKSPHLLQHWICLARVLEEFSAWHIRTTDNWSNSDPPKCLFFSSGELLSGGQTTAAHIGRVAGGAPSS
jgi:hypothetical protein